MQTISVKYGLSCLPIPPDAKNDLMCLYIYQSFPSPLVNRSLVTRQYPHDVVDTGLRIKLPHDGSVWRATWSHKTNLPMFCLILLPTRARNSHWPTSHFYGWHKDRDECESILHSYGRNPLRNIITDELKSQINFI